jgi:hypothetical protein
LRPSTAALALDKSLGTPLRIAWERSKQAKK